jgi:nitronate monooxygenase
MTSATFARTGAFCTRFGLKLPILLAPMAGVPAPALSIEVGKAGGLGACGVLPMTAADIVAWVDRVRAAGVDAFQLNTWIPDPPPHRDREHESRVRAFLERWGPPVPAQAADAPAPDFRGQFEAMVAARPPVISSVMGLYDADQIAALKANGIAWFATITTVNEARMAAAAGADALMAQGAEAGGHRGTFDAASAERRMAGLIALVPAVVDAVSLPVIATGGIADGRGAAAAFALGASAVQIGSAFLRCPESDLPPAWREALARAAPDDTMLTRVFSGRPGRSLATPYVIAATSGDAPDPAPYPIQRALTAPMRAAAVRDGDGDRMQAWAGQSAALSRSMAAGDLVRHIWEGACELLK